MQTINPAKWIADKLKISQAVNNPKVNHTPMIYVAHPVAPVEGQRVIRCQRCMAVGLFTLATLDLRILCDCGGATTESANPAAIIEANLRSAMAWWRFLHLGLPDATFVMPWYVNVLANGEGDKELIERGLRDDEKVAYWCDAVLNCGPRISSGMRRESLACSENGGEVFQIEGNPKHLRTHEAQVYPWRVVEGL